MKTKFQLEIQQPGKKPALHEITAGVYPIGSEMGNKIVIPDSRVSGKHAILAFRKNECWVEDLNSKTGTFVNEQAVHGKMQFSAGDKIRIGSYILAVKQQEEKSKAELVSASPPVEREHAPGKHAHAEQICQIKKQIHTELLERLDIKRLTAAHIQEADLHKRVRQTLKQIVNDVKERLPEWISAEALIKEIYDEAVGLGPLEDLLADPEITEIMVNQNDQIYIEKHGKLILSDRVFMDNSSILAIIQRIVAPIGRRIDESQPYVDARLKDGSRVNAIIPPLALNGPTLTIRKFSKNPFTTDDLISFGTIDSKIAEFLKICVLLRKNIIVSGGTGSGKTTFLNVMSSFLPESDRIITIEDSAELRLTQQHLIRLEARPPNIEGRGAVTIRDLLRNCLRMRPDRLIIGECRGAETLDMLQAMNTGHDGSITTVHANSPRDVIARLETMVLMSGIDLPTRAIREQIASAIKLIIHTARFSDGTRKAVTITEIVGLEGERITMQDIFQFKQKGIDAEGRVVGSFIASGAVPTFLEEIKPRGLSLDISIFNPDTWKH